MRKEGKRKALAALVCGSMLTVALVGGTLAYLADTDSDVNVMTLGNVKIAQHEYERVVDANGDYTTIDVDGTTSYELQEFTQAKPLYPFVGEVNNGYDSTQVRLAQLGHNSRGGMDVLPAANVQDKFVVVENTGKSDAYVRTIVAFEAGSVAEEDWVGLINYSYHFTWEETDNRFVTKINGNNYYLVEFVYNGYEAVQHPNGVLKPGDYTYNSLAQVYMFDTATNEDVEAIDGNKNGMFDILVVSQAVQTAGFADAESALNEAFGEINENNHPWATVQFEAPEMVDNVLNLDSDYILFDEALFSDYTATEPYAINGNGATITGVASSVDSFQWKENGTIPVMSAIFSSAGGDQVTVNDLTFTGTMSAVMAGHYVNSSSNWYNTEFNNVDIIDAEVVSFSANISPALCIYGKMVMNGCNVYGTTLSPLDTDPMWPVYDVAAVNYSDTTINNSKIGSLHMWNQAKVTVAAGSDVDTIVVRGNMNTTKYGLTVKAGASVGAIDLSAITDKTRVNITLEDGASVGKFVANGIEYATLNDWQNAQ